MGTLRFRATGTAAVILGLTALLVIAGVLALWITVEIIIAVLLFSIGQGFLGGCMAAIAGLNILAGLVWIARAIR